jgi:tetratricopeptide (TPR) repeat protein
VLAFFGAPIAHEDDAERAARAGLEILSGIQPFAEDIKEEFDIDFDLRVGINTGPVVVGEIGTDLAMEYTAMGDAANVAARMEQTAKPGTLQISEDTYKRIEKLFRTESLGTIELKGKDQPVEAYRVLEARSHPGRTRGIEGLTAPLVGRASELEQLQQVMFELEAGRGAILTLLGEAGLGKSRLIDEISRWAHEQAESKAEWLFAAGVSYNMSLPFGVFRRMLRTQIDVEESSPPAETSQKIFKFMEQFPADLQDRIQLAFKIILGLELDAESAEMDAEARKREVFQGMTELLQWFSQQSPLVMVLDDLHWADPVSVELINHLFRLSDEIPVLFLCSLRPHRNAAGWAIKLHGETEFPHRYSEITLHPLSAQHSEELIDALLRVSNLPTNLRELIKSKAEGNPFFVEEVIRMLIEQGIIARDEERDRWVAVKEPDEVIIPDNLNGLLTARIDRLPAETRMTLQYAAVIGRTFDQPVLASAIESNGHLQDHLSTLQRHELIREVRRLPEVQYMFTHELTRDAAYSTLLRRQRRRFHRKVGETLEALYGERLEEFAGRLGYHFQQSGQRDKARNYYDRAGDHAASLYANDEAIEYYRREVELVPEGEVGSESWTRLLQKLGRVHEMSGNWQEALSLYRQIENQGIQQSDPRLELEGLLPQVTIYSVPTDVRDRDSGPALAERALEIAESLENPEATAKTLWNLLLQHFYMGLDYEKGVESGERALEIAREHDLKDLLPFILNDLGRAYSSTYRFDESIAAQKEAESLWRVEGNMPMLADNLTTAANSLYGIGELEESIQYAEEALEISKRIGNLWGQAYSMMVYAGTKVERGEISEAIAMIQECVRIGSEGNFFAASIFPPIYLTWTYSWLGATDLAMEQASDSYVFLDDFPAFQARAELIKAYVHLRRDEVDTAYELYAKWHKELEVVVPDLFATALTWVIAGEILLRKGMVDDALSLVSKLEGFAEKSGGMWCFSDVCLLKARAMYANGKPEEGRQLLLLAEEDSARIGSKRGQLNSLAACIEHLSSSWDDHKKRDIAQKSKALINFMEAHIESESLLKAFLSSAPVSIIKQWLASIDELST